MQETTEDHLGSIDEMVRGMIYTKAAMEDNIIVSDIRGGYLSINGWICSHFTNPFYNKVVHFGSEISQSADHTTDNAQVMDSILGEVIWCWSWILSSQATSVMRHHHWDKLDT